jgi:hypothetical protein
MNIVSPMYSCQRMHICCMKHTRREKLNFAFLERYNPGQAAETVRKSGFFSRNDSTGKKKEFLSERLLRDLDSSCRAFQCYWHCAKYQVWSTSSAALLCVKWDLQRFLDIAQITGKISMLLLCWPSTICWGSLWEFFQVLLRDYNSCTIRLISYRPCTAVNACTFGGWSGRGEKSWILLFSRDRTQRRRSEQKFFELFLATT